MTTPTALEMDRRYQEAMRRLRVEAREDFRHFLKNMFDDEKVILSRQAKFEPRNSIVSRRGIPKKFAKELVREARADGLLRKGFYVKYHMDYSMELGSVGITIWW